MIWKSPYPSAQKTWQVTMTLNTLLGFTHGFSMFVWGALFYEQFVLVSSPAFAISATTALYGFLRGLIMLLEVPTGALGDAVGRKWSVVVSYAIKVFFFLLIALVPFCHNVPILIAVSGLALTVNALSFTFYSGSFTAWCIDTLRHEAPEIGYEQLLAPAKRLYFVGCLTSGVASILLYLQGLPSVAFVIGACLSFVAMIYSYVEMTQEQNVNYLTFREVNFGKITRRMGEIVGVGFMLFRSSRALLFLVFIFAAYRGILELVYYLWPVYLRSSIPVEAQQVYWVGLVIGLQLSSFFGSQGLTKWTKKWKKSSSSFRAQNSSLRRALVGSCLLAALPVLFLSFMTTRGEDNFWLLVVAIVPVQIAYGIIWPVFETLINNYIPDNHASERATIMSLASLVASFLVMIVAIPTGGSSGAKTPIGWAIPAGILLIAALIGNFFLKRAEKKGPDIMPIRIDEPEEEIIAAEPQCGSAEKADKTIVH